MTISCAKLRGIKSTNECDAVCVIERRVDFEVELEDWYEVFRTERNYSINPTFQERFRIRFYPDHDTILRFTILDLRGCAGEIRGADAVVGQMSCRLFDIVDSPPVTGKDSEESSELVKRVLFTRPLRDPLVNLFSFDILCFLRTNRHQNRLHSSEMSN